ncbi:MAG: radical SAM protein [Candidatus Altiarchaeales archaeon]|nr:radical SAM protein [Candidatus Altiarchaeales archaeon]MBD3416249.1 radical SAM protein [Candidatus Altiarchaeales archaeon]
MDEIRYKTESLCPICLRKLEAEVYVKDGTVIVSRECEEHGEFDCLHAWDDPEIFKRFMDISHKLVENRFNDLTIDVTDRCNMRCPFCFNTAKDEPSLDRIIEKAKAWENGNIVLYGGEPTMRDDLPELITELKSMGFGVILLSNGLRIDEKLADKLDNSRLDGIVLQFDSVDDDINERMRGMRVLERKLNAIESLKDGRIWLSLFVVIMKDTNEDQIPDIINLACKESELVRTVLFAPVSPEGIEGSERGHIRNRAIFDKIGEAGITKDDFMENSEFDISLTKFLSKMGIRRKSITLCEALCYVYRVKDHFIPLNHLVDLKAITNALDESDSAMSLAIKLLKYNVKADLRLLPAIMRVSARIMRTLVFRVKFDDNIPGMVGILVNPTQTRYNADYNFIRTCNLYSDTREGITTYCENNIFSTGKKNSEKLEKSHFYQMKTG